MQILKQIVTNEFLLVPVAAWAISQILKVFTSMAVNKKFDINEIKRDGGMPSAHSAMVTSLMCVIGFNAGFDSSMFAIAFVFGAIIMRDAVGVRRECGKQAAVIKSMTEKLGLCESESGAAQLKLGGGHTPLQLLVGAAVGLAVGLIYVFVIAG